MLPVRLKEAKMNRTRTTQIQKVIKHTPEAELARRIGAVMKRNDELAGRSPAIRPVRITQGG